MVLKGLEHVTYRDRLRELGTVQPQEENVWVAFIIVKIPDGSEKGARHSSVKETAVRTHQNAVNSI